MDRSFPTCPACGDRRVLSLARQACGSRDVTRFRYACGHSIWTDVEDGRTLTTGVADPDPDRERAKRRHPSAGVRASQAATVHGSGRGLR